MNPPCQDLVHVFSYLWLPVALRTSASIHNCALPAARRSPLINRGYYVRHKCLLDLLENFRERCSTKGTGCQVLVLGAGYDTRYFQLKQRVRSVFAFALILNFVVSNWSPDRCAGPVGASASPPPLWLARTMSHPLQRKHR